jgi:hypothetical protein
MLLGILISKGLTARRPYKSFGVKGLTCSAEIEPGKIKREKSEIV